MTTTEAIEQCETALADVRECVEIHDGVLDYLKESGASADELAHHEGLRDGATRSASLIASTLERLRTDGRA